MSRRIAGTKCATPGHHEHRRQPDGDGLRPAVDVVDAQPADQPGAECAQDQSDDDGHFAAPNLDSDKM